MKKKSGGSLTKRPQEQRAYIAVHQVLNRLNAEPEDPAVRRVQEILSMLTDAEHLRSQLWRLERKTIVDFAPMSPRLWKAGTGSDLEFKNSDSSRMYEDFKRRIERAALLLSAYEWTFMPTWTEYLSVEKAIAWRSEGDGWERGAILQLLTHLPGEGPQDYPFLPSGLSRFRHCERCSKWLYAVKAHQKFCDAQCRVSNLTENESFKAKRRNYMRTKYRPTLKAKQAAEDALSRTSRPQKTQGTR
jgi:hypothetical protein